MKTGLLVAMAAVAWALVSAEVVTQLATVPASLAAMSSERRPVALEAAGGGLRASR